MIQKTNHPNVVHSINKSIRYISLVSFNDILSYFSGNQTELHIPNPGIKYINDMMRRIQT
jgi:hypothetical protein